MKFKLLTETATPPSKANVWDAGWDLYCDEHVAIMPGMRQMIKTGLALDIPQGHVGDDQASVGLSGEIRSRCSGRGC